MSKRKDGGFRSDRTVEIGNRFGRLVVTADAENIGCRRRVVATCDCGAERTFFLARLRAGKTKSCGCYKRDARAELMRRMWDLAQEHGLTAQARVAVLGAAK